MTKITANQSYSSTALSSTSDFVDTIGVNVHLTWVDTVYSNVANIESNLDYLGIDNIRDSAPPDWLSQPYDQLASAGYQFDFLMPVNNGQPDLNGSIERMAAFEQAHPGSILSIEGPNEVNYSPAQWNGSTSLQSEAQLQHALFDAVQQNGALSDVPVVDLTLAGVGPSAYAPLGDLTSASDLGNAHIYFPGGDAPSTIWDYGVNTGETPTDGSPMVVTETGYYSMPDNDRGVDTTVQAKYTLDLLFDAAESGVKTTYLYELLDDFADSGNTNPENHYGLFNNDGSAKPVATAIHNLTTILHAQDGEAAESNPDFNFSFSNLPDTAHQMALQAGDGSTDIVVWAEPDIWDNSTQRELTAQTYQTTLNLGSSHADITVYDPMTGTSAVKTADAAGSVTFELSDHPVVINVSDVNGGTVASTDNGATTASAAPSTSDAGGQTATDGQTASSSSQPNETAPTTPADSGSSTSDGGTHASTGDSGTTDTSTTDTGSKTASSADSGSTSPTTSGSNTAGNGTHTGTSATDTSATDAGSKTAASGDSGSTGTGTHVASGGTGSTPSEGSSSSSNGTDSGTTTATSSNHDASTTGNTSSDQGGHLPWMSGSSSDSGHAMSWLNGWNGGSGWGQHGSASTGGSASAQTAAVDPALVADSTKTAANDSASNGASWDGHHAFGSGSFNFDHFNNHCDHHAGDWALAS